LQRAASIVFGTKVVEYIEQDDMPIDNNHMAAINFMFINIPLDRQSFFS
jgi:hypothetical protein